MSRDPEHPIELICPCCRTELTVDRGSGEVLHERRPKRAGPSWEEALAAGKQKEAQAEKLFSQGIERERNADSLLEKKFREALKRADDGDDPPPRIFDLD